MQPEILNRCQSCGATIRDPEMFCPECGKALAETNQSATTEPEPAISGAPESDKVKRLEPSDEAVDSAELDSSKPDGNKRRPRVIRPDDGLRHTAREKTRETLHRASNVARGAIEDNVKRVEKIHHVSTVMLEEATYDPSLRFVLVAAGLFVIFVILLVVSKVMG